MASNNFDGTKKLQATNTKTVSHNGDKIVVGDTLASVVIERKDNTSVRLVVN